MPTKQDVVKLDVVSEISEVDNLPKKLEQNARFSLEPSKDSVVEIVLSNATIRFVNKYGSSY